MRKFSLVLIVLLGIAAGYAIYSREADAPVEAARPELATLDSAESESGAEPDSEELVSPRVEPLHDELAADAAPTANPDDVVREALLEESLPESPAKPKLESTPDPLAGWEGPWSKDLEVERRVVLDPASTLDQKGSSLKRLSLLRDLEGEDPRTEEVLREAAWILSNTSDEGVLDDVLDGLEDVRHESLVEPLIGCLINHRSAKVRKAAAEALWEYRGNDRADETLAHAAQYDENQDVRLAAQGK